MDLKTMSGYFTQIMLSALRRRQYMKLHHARRMLPGDAQVIVVDTGAVIDAEADAMLQALHSRSIGGFGAHIIKLIRLGAQGFMKMFYVGYGHKSIGDCGSATIFIEGVSMLAAKAIQDFMLYNGQEASTRYIDFAKQPFIDLFGGSWQLSSWVLRRWRALYLFGLQTLKDDLQIRHPYTGDESKDVYTKAINARAFDIMRSFLPAGASTNLAWHGNLRQMADHLLRLRHHPLPEVRNIAIATEDALIERFPSSFSTRRYDATEQYYEEAMTESYYYDRMIGDTLSGRTVKLVRNDVDRYMLWRHRKLLMTRPPKTELPKFVAECGSLCFEYMLDFASFRDIQRQRSVIQRMPLLTGRFGMHPWYFAQMPEHLQETLRSSLAVLLGEIEASGLPPVLKQYYLPMGMQVPCRMTGDIPALVYIAELRSSGTVHPTLRPVAQDMGKILLDQFRHEGLVLHMDFSEDRFSTKRGLHDIVERK